MQNLDLSENYPGKTLRAYVRTLFDVDLSSPMQSLDYPGVWEALAFEPGVSELLVSDEAKWTMDFAEDGLRSERITLVRFAAEGYITNLRWREHFSPNHHRYTLKLMLDLTKSNGEVR